VRKFIELTFAVLFFAVAATAQDVSKIETFAGLTLPSATFILQVETASYPRL
jgi:hypothetical protein